MGDEKKFALLVDRVLYHSVHFQASDADNVYRDSLGSSLSAENSSSAKRFRTFDNHANFNWISLL